MNAWLTVARKELVDGARDRRVWLVVFVTSLASGPLTMLLISRFVADLKSRVSAREVFVKNAADAPALMNALMRAGKEATPAPGDVRARIEAGQFDNAVLEIPSSFEERIRRGETVDITILHDANRAQSTTAAATIERLVNGWLQEIGSQRLMARGVDPSLLRPARATIVAIGANRGDAARLLFLVPLIALLSTVIGALAIAIDVTAGERERGSLEPLLLNPVQPIALVVGKWVAVSVASIVTLGGTLVSFVLASAGIQDDSLSAAFQFGASEAAMTFALLVPFGLLISAVLMLAAVSARSHKEAQASTGYILTVVSFTPTVSMFLSLQDARWQLFVPVLGQNMVLSRIFRGSPITALDLVIPMAMSVALTALALATQAKLLASEAIVFAKS
jgi:sodium transport system permease protein